MPAPLPHQIVGAKFLSDRNFACLADAPRVGKTGAAILAADDVLARRILVITTASGRAVWLHGFKTWSWLGRTAEVYSGGKLTDKHRRAEILIVGWGAIAKLDDLGPFTLIIADESHYAKSIEAKRTKALYGEFRGAARGEGLVDRTNRLWCLTGTPVPNAPNDLYPMLRALAPERLTTTHGPTDVSKYEDFLHRYCIVRKKVISRWNKIDVVIGGRRLDELKARIGDFLLRRTQEDVGITRPIYDLLPILISDAQRRRIEAEIEDAEEILDAAETGETKSLEIHLGTLRRLTGSIKAEGVAQAVKDEMDGGLDRIVIMAWHKEVLDRLADALSPYGVVRVDGSTSPTKRDSAVHDFQNREARVFLGQIIACGEAIDLSASAELVFAESSFVPKDMSQASLRITNHGQTRQPRVRVAALEGSLDEALQSILIRKVEAIKGVLA